jgi:hypothetical protein
METLVRAGVEDHAQAGAEAGAKADASAECGANQALHDLTARLRAQTAE